MPFESFSLNTDSLASLSAISQINGRRVVDKIIECGIVQETQMMEHLHLSKSQLFKVCDNLNKTGSIIIRWRDKNSNIPCYTLHPKFFDISEKCKVCSYYTRATKKIADKEIVYAECGWDTSAEVQCVNDYQRKNYNLVQALLQTHVQADSERVDRENIQRTSTTKKITDWKINDYVQYYKELLRERMPEMTPDNAHTIRHNLRTIIDNFKEKLGGKWRRMLKTYVRKQFEEAIKEGRFLTSNQLAKGASIGKFLKKQKKEEKEIQFCKMKNIYCSYMKNKCQIIANGMSCTKRIRSKMRKLYN